MSAGARVGRRFALRNLSAALAFLLCASHVAVAQQTTTPPQTRVQKPTSGEVQAKSADGAFISQFSCSTTADEPTWNETLRKSGLVPWRDKMWHLEAPDGEVRAEAFFLEDHTSVWLLFFLQPARRSMMRA